MMALNPSIKAVEASDGLDQEAKLDKSLADNDIKNKIIEAIRLLHEVAEDLMMNVTVKVSPDEVAVVGKDGYRHGYSLHSTKGLGTDCAPEVLANSMAATKCAQAILGDRDRVWLRFLEVLNELKR
jgi:hypothetical protein